METIVSIILITIGLWLIRKILAQSLRGEVDLLSTRNFFFVGFLIFHVTSGVLAVWFPLADEFAISDVTRPAFIFCWFVVLFLAIFLFTYKKGWGVRRLAWSVTPQNAPAPIVLLMLGIPLVGLGLVFRFLLTGVPIFGALSGMFGAGLMALAAGVVSWAWFPRLFNPFFATIALAVIVTGIAGTLMGSFGRRDVLGVLTGVAWGAYHGWYKHMGPRRVLTFIAVLSVPAMVLMAGFTAVRHINKTDRSVGQLFSEAAAADIGQGILDLFSGQRCANYVMFFISTRPESKEYDTLHQVKLFLSFPVPRQFWDDKPDAVARTVVKEVNVQGVPEGFNIGPGLLGHAANDNPWIALPLYAVCLALFLRLLDEMIVVHPNNPFVVLPVGAAIGQIMGLARGETASFLFHACAAVAISWVMMRVFAAVGRALGWGVGAQRAFEAEQADLDVAYANEAAAYGEGAAGGYGDDDRVA
ncbi:MAG: hypothetical protein HUU19_10840 [Phycisphaerales bacterium]|nr:hypothetical protein [Phycisphaerales bacterium]